MANEQHDTLPATEFDFTAIPGPNEKLLWTGQPPIRMPLYRIDILVWLLSALACAGARHMATIYYGSKYGILVVILAVLFVIAVLIFLFFYHGNTLATQRHQFYAVTDQRILIHYEFPQKFTYFIRYSMLSSIELRKHRNGRGSLTFIHKKKESVPWDVKYRFFFHKGIYPPTFHHIPEAEKVYQLISQEWEQW